MILKMYCIYDGAAKAFNTPFYRKMEAEALRAFRNTINAETVIAENPHDFSLFYLGTYDDDTGLVDQSEGVKNLGSALYFMAQEEGKKIVNFDKELEAKKCAQ